MRLQLVDRRLDPVWRPGRDLLVRLADIWAPVGKPDWLAELVLVDDVEMADLNLRYRKVEGVTDVLSFSQLEERGPGLPDLTVDERFAGRDLWRGGPAGEAISPVGEVVVAVDFVRERCGASGWRWPDELALLAVHGLLHLVGWEHPDPEAAATMRLPEAELLARGGFAHPLLERGQQNRWKAK